MTQAFNLSQFANKVNSSGQADLTTAVTGTLPKANGGTGLISTGTSGNVLTSDGTNWISSAIGNAATVTNGVYTTSFTGSNQSLTSSGYQKIVGGLIIQWGITGSISNGGVISITFPIAFPNAAFFNNLQQVNNGTGNTYGTGSGTLTTTGITGLSSCNISTAFRWLAIGY